VIIFVEKINLIDNIKLLDSWNNKKSISNFITKVMELAYL